MRSVDKYLMHDVKYPVFQAFLLSLALSCYGKEECIDVEDDIDGSWIDWWKKLPQRLQQPLWDVIEFVFQSEETVLTVPEIRNVLLLVVMVLLPELTRVDEFRRILTSTPLLSFAIVATMAKLFDTDA